MTGKTIIPRSVAVGVVTFNPSKSLLARLSIALSSGFILYVFDNSPAESIIRDFCTSHDNCKYFTCGKNVGLGYGISTICAQAYYNSHPALIFFDQDTVFNQDTLEFIEDFRRENKNIEPYYSAIVFNSKNRSNKRSEDRFGFKDVLLARNSGCLYFLENLKAMNWHNEAYFVDGVDYEFCLNSYNHKLKIGECSLTPGFDHQSEQEDDNYTLFGKKYYLRKYNRNRIIDVLYSSAKLLFTSIVSLNFKFTKEIGWLTIKYIASQVIVRFAGRSYLKKGSTK